MNPIFKMGPLNKLYIVLFFFPNILSDTFLYQHFKRTGHSPNNVLVQPVEKLTYDKNSSSRFEIIKRHETELKGIKLLQI